MRKEIVKRYPNGNKEEEITYRKDNIIDFITSYKENGTALFRKYYSEDQKEITTYFYVHGEEEGQVFSKDILYDNGNIKKHIYCLITGDPDERPYIVANYNENGFEKSRFIYNEITGALESREISFENHDTISVIKTDYYANGIKSGRYVYDKEGEIICDMSMIPYPNRNKINIKGVSYEELSKNFGNMG